MKSASSGLKTGSANLIAIAKSAREIKIPLKKIALFSLCISPIIIFPKTYPSAIWIINIIKTPSCFIDNYLKYNQSKSRLKRLPHSKPKPSLN